MFCVVVSSKIGIFASSCLCTIKHHFNINSEGSIFFLLEEKQGSLKDLLTLTPRETSTRYIFIRKQLGTWLVEHFKKQFLILMIFTFTCDHMGGEWAPMLYYKEDAYHTHFPGEETEVLRGWSYLRKPPRWEN